MYECKKSRRPRFVTSYRSEGKKKVSKITKPKRQIRPCMPLHALTNSQKGICDYLCPPNRFTNLVTVTVTTSVHSNEFNCDVKGPMTSHDNTLEPVDLRDEKHYSNAKYEQLTQSLRKLIRLLPVWEFASPNRNATPLLC